MGAPERRTSSGDATSTDPVQSASAAGLVYVTGREPGIRRRRAGKGFSYLDPQGRPVKDGETLARIRSLAIPPAWRDVWICASPRGHLQARGHDQKGRKQYRYHPRWREARDETKFSRMLAFAQALPRIRAAVERDLAQKRLSREKVLALVVRLLEITLIRVGNEEYTRQNSSFGLTTLRDRHVSVSGSRTEFRFRGKGGKPHTIELTDARLSRLLKKCQELPGQELFQYLDEDGQPRSISSGDVNDYLRAVSGEDFTAKDFRTWNATVLAAWTLHQTEPRRAAKQAKRRVLRAIERVAERLGNTPTVCRKSYVHPAVIDSYLDGSLAEALLHRAGGEVRDAAGLPPHEAAVVALLTRGLHADTQTPVRPPARRLARARASAA